MTEFMPAPDEVRERRSVIAAFAARAIMRASSHAFISDLDDAICYSAQNTYYLTGEPIDESDLSNMASASVLSQIARSFTNQRPIRLYAELPQEKDIYKDSQEVVDEVGLTLVETELDMTTVRNVAKCLDGRLAPHTPAAAAASKTWQQRGSVSIQVESIADIANAAESIIANHRAPDGVYVLGGSPVEVHQLTALEVPSRTIEVPFYDQFCEVEHGTPWLEALLQDLAAIHSQIS